MAFWGLGLWREGSCRARRNTLWWHVPRVWIILLSTRTNSGKVDNIGSSHTRIWYCARAQGPWTVRYILFSRGGGPFVVPNIESSGKDKRKGYRAIAQEFYINLQQQEDLAMAKTSHLIQLRNNNIHLRRFENDQVVATVVTGNAPFPNPLKSCSILLALHRYQEIGKKARR